MDKLKEYLLRHKADLDVDSPAGDTWEYIGSKIPAKPGFSSWLVRYAAAACVIALAGAGLWLVINTPQHTTKNTPPHTTANTLPKEEKTPEKDIVRNTPKPKQTRRKARHPKPDQLSDQVDVIDKSYASLIDYQLRKLRATPLYAENSSYFSFYVEQFKQMDQDEQAVRNDIKTYGLTNEMLEQLINVYQQKLNVLKSLQTEVNKMNNKVREKQAPSEKPEVHYLDI